MQFINLNNPKAKLLVDDDGFTLAFVDSGFSISGQYDEPDIIEFSTAPKQIVDAYLMQDEVLDFHAVIEDITTWFKVVIRLKPGTNFFELDHTVLNEVMELV